MTFGEFKALLTEAGSKDSDEIGIISVGLVFPDREDLKVIVYDGKIEITEAK